MEIIVLLLFLFGVCIGSFVNVLIDRLPNAENVFVGRSHCDFCKKPLRWYELIPLISFLLQGGRCRRCHRLLSIQYPLVELMSAVALVCLYLTFSISVPFFAYALIFFPFLVLFVADLKYQILPDSMLVGAALGGILLILFSHNAQLITNNLLSALGASLFFLALFLITRGRGMGFGDVKLAFVMGFLLGFPQIVVALYIAFLTGAGVGVILVLRRKKTLQSHVAFGPFLLIGYAAAATYGMQLYELWRRLL